MDYEIAWKVLKTTILVSSSTHKLIELKYLIKMIEEIEDDSANDIDLPLRKDSKPETS